MRVLPIVAGKRAHAVIPYLANALALIFRRTPCFSFLLWLRISAISLVRPESAQRSSFCWAASWSSSYAASNSAGVGFIITPANDGLVNASDLGRLTAPIASSPWSGPVLLA